MAAGRVVGDADPYNVIVGASIARPCPFAV